MSDVNYLPLLILPLAGLAILIVILLIVATDKNRDHHRTPAE